MTDEIYNALANLEPVLEKVRKREYVSPPSLATKQLMLAAIRENQPRFRTNLGCSSCLKSLFLNAAGLYFTEKERREKEAAAQPKKTTRKKKTEE